MTKTFGVRVDKLFVPVAIERKGEIVILNSLVLIIDGNTTIECDEDTDYKTVKDLHSKLGQQFIHRPTHILREDVDSNELEN